MASKKKQKDMVFHPKGAATPTTADQPPACFVVPKSGQAGEGRMERSTSSTNDEPDITLKSNVCSSRQTIRTSGGLPALKHSTSLNPRSNNLSPDCTFKGIRVTLDNNSMWNEFFRCKTEMILTQQGSRMFPYCRFRISGLQPSRKYSLIMDIQPFDNSRYRWTGKNWQVDGKAEVLVKSPSFAHPESPSTGQHWMQNPVSFYKMKLTNNISDQEGNTVLHPMHRYLPRLHVVPNDKAAKDIKLNSPSVVTFTFPQTEFMAVTSYQNSQFAQLKVDYNPFVKGLKEDVSSSWALKLKLNCGNDLHKDDSTTNEKHPVKKSLKSLLTNHKLRSTKAADSKPSVSDDLQENATTNKDHSAAKVPAETQRTCPAQKLFSELIREAHVSLQRCDLEPLGCSNITEPTDGVTVTTTPDKKGLTLLKNKVKEEQGLLNSPNNQHKPEAPSEVNVKLHKRPRPLPLPALALFLKQHSAKSKNTKNNQDSRRPACPMEPQNGSLRSAAADLPADHATNTAGPLKGCSGDLTELDQMASEHAAVPPGVILLNVTREAVESVFNLPSSSRSELKEPRTDDPLDPISVAESPDPTQPNGAPALSNSEQPSCTIVMSPSTVSSPLATSSSSLILSPPPDTVLPVLNSPQTLSVRGLSMLGPDSPTNKGHCLLPDQECCSFGFEPLSPVCSPDVLPPLPASLALELDPNSEATPRAIPSEGFLQKEDNAASVFKWHTVLQPPEPYLAASFTTCQTTSQTLPLEPVSSPLLPSPTLSHVEEQTHTSTSTPLPGPPSFQESEQLPPFTADLSPLTLQLPLSPTFSSLDGEGLSPTPSIADLVHFFSTNEDLGMGVDFSGTEAVAVAHPPPNTVDANAQESSQKVQTVPRNKPCKRKRKSRRQKLAQMNTDPKPDDSTYTSMQPNLEEVEEQLFISFTSKEALKLHIPASSEGNVPQPQMTLEGHVTQPVDPPENGLTSSLSNCWCPAETQELRIATGQKHLLRDLRLMKHKQVIHPVLQEVGLKMNLLDSTLAIDLQYLGVRLPLPPPGVSLEPWTQELPPSQGAAAAFVSRTGKTTDITQIKGWRDKFSHSEAPPTASSARPEAGPTSEPKKNLSAFCSDMLDQYLESEGKLMDERASSFSPPAVPVVYELPTQSASYVRTLDSVLRKHGTGSADLISGFVPPSKRPRLSLRQMKTSRRRERKHRGPKRTRHRPEPTADPLAAPNPAGPNLITNKQVVLTSAQHLPSKHTTTLPGLQRPRKKQLKVLLDHSEPLSPLPQTPIFKKRKKLKSKTTSNTLSHTKSKGTPLGPSKDLTPLDLDFELAARADQDQGPVITRATLRLKDLEDSVVWEGRARTSVTAERATIALTSLFTLMGFVSENPTTPIQLVRRRAPPCLNEFCRLGCVCTALTHSSRLGHCGRPHCMFSCSCLKQTVVLLKNLEALESAPPQPSGSRRKRRRMKMAYVLKEADSVSQPAKQIRILWKRDGKDSDPDPVHAPEPAPLALPISRENRSCARSRVFQGKTRSQKQKDNVMSKPVRLKPLKQRDLTLKRTKTRPFCPPTSEPAQPAPSHKSPPHLPRSSPPPSPSEPTPKPSKRLIILAECKWASDADRNHVLRKLCEAMAQDRLESRFWIRQYLISPISQTTEESGTDCCIQYRVHISRPSVDRERPAALLRPQPQARQRKKKPHKTHDHLQQVKQEAEPLEDWQREVEDSDTQEEVASTLHQAHVAEERSGRKIKAERKKMVSMALPFLTGISPAGFLSANRKQPGGTDHLVQVNGKLYPLAKIQLGRMGALHPANRLAAYLTGRVGSNRKQPGCPSSSPQTQSPAPPPEAVRSTSSVLTDPPSLVPPPYASDSGVQGRNPSVGSAVPGNSQLLIQVPAPVKVPVLGVAPPPSSQRMVLQLVQAHSGIQYYRKPDGKLVQLIPLSQLRPVNSKLPVQTGVPVASCQAPPIRQTSPQASVNSPPSSSSSTLSGLKSFSVSALPAPLTPASGFLSQKGTCTFKILPTASNKDPLIFTCPRLPPCLPTKVTKAVSSFTLVCPHPKSPNSPANVISLKPSSCQGVELGVKTVSVSAVAGPGGGSAPQKPTSPQAPAILQNPSENTHRVGSTQLHTAGSEFTPVHTVYPPIEPEPARNPVDLDIICVDDEMGLVTTETKSKEAIGSSSGETENSSDMEDDLLSEEEKETSNNTKRHIHNTLERLRRVKLLQLFAHLRKELALSHNKTSKICTLNRAVQVIQDLRETEVDLKRKKRTLMERRDEFLSTLAPLAGLKAAPPTAETNPSDLTPDKSSKSKTGTETRAGPEEVNQSEQAEGPSNVDDDDVTVEAVEPVDNNSPLSNERRPEKIMKDTEAQSVSAAFRDLRTVMNSKHSSKTLLLAQALDQIMTLKAEMNSLKSLKILLKQKRDTYIRKISQRSGKSEHSVLRKLQYLSSKQKKMEEQERAANDLPAATGGGASDSPAEDIGDDDIIIISSNLQQQTPQAPPTPISVAPTATRPQTAVNQEIVQLSKSTFTRPAVSHKAPTARARPRTIPNILSRSKNPTPLSPGLAMNAGAPPSACEAPPFHTLVPPEVLSVVGASLPRQSVLTLSPVIAGPTVLQMTPIPGTNSPLTLLAQQQLIAADQPPPPLPMVLCTASDRVKDQDQSPSQTDLSRSRGGGSLGPKRQPEAGGGETESLTSLLNEIVFLNQRTISMVTTERLSSERDVTEGEAEDQGHTRSTKILRLESDTGNSVTMETEDQGPRGGVDVTQTGPTNGNNKVDVLTPPPLLQMKVGGVKVAEPTNSSPEAAEGRSVAEGGLVGGVVWRPMPRLVPLGLRGNTPS
ncbi:MAX dimerization protein MGA a isoform X2 [Echeneis naucrates]|uniref:MAX dimerization protein MGA a isoform X2 n=1 Tax=Echeneis naucrates TaxID=173247 RepID=UPI00111458F5|nr:MAX gene-associated protein-like isoform X2 [Echeneis naucrates]